MQIKDMISPVPQQITPLEGHALTLTTDSRFFITAPEAEFGPVRTAAQKLREHLHAQCGDHCLAPDGLPVTLALGNAPTQVKNADEAYRLLVTVDGITITGFGPAGLLYGVFTLLQLLRWEDGRVSVPAVDILDWPDNPLRGFKEECRYGSNMMERQDWMDLLEDLAARKINFLGLALYGCWTVQYSGKLAEFLYLPVKDHPELQSPQEVRYYSPEENRWIDYEQLPPIFRDNLLDDIFRRARDLGIQVCPSWNSYGHNTLIPRMVPSVSAKEADGVTPTEFGFCTSSEETFDLLFSIYDQIIDNYMTPYGMTAFATLLDEVWDKVGMNAKNPFAATSAFCQCDKCKDKDRGQMFIDMLIKTTRHLKEKGIKSVLVANDMLYHEHHIPGLKDRLWTALRENDLLDVLLLDWWDYTDVESKFKVKELDTQSGLRNITCPWTGYHNWNAVYHPLNNVRLMAQMNKRGNGYGTMAYSNWDRSCARTYDALADYTWNFDGAGENQDITDRYLKRHFSSRYDEARRAYKLMDLISEERVWEIQDPDRRILSHFNLMFYRLGFYNHTYVATGKPYPRNFPGEPVALLLGMRADAERELVSIASMAAQARAILLDLAQDARCNRSQALRMAYECENYLNTAEDFLALLEMHDMTARNDYASIAALARKRQKARLDQMAFCERAKEKFIVKALTMRNLSVYMQFFCDIADYIAATPDPKLDMTDLMPILSQRSLHLR